MIMMIKIRVLVVVAHLLFYFFPSHFQTGGEEMMYAFTMLMISLRQQEI
jgi:hypothetical protein